MIALSLFLGVIVAVATAGLQVSSILSRAELKQVVLASMGKDLETLGSGGFDELVGEHYTAPDACASRGVGRQTSCQSAHGRTFTIRYATKLGSDPVLGSGASGSFVSITARSSLPDGTTVTATRMVTAPSLGFTGDGAVLRIRSLSKTKTDQLPLLVLDTTGTPVAPAVPFVNDLAVVRVPGDACIGERGPCRLALTTGATYWSTAGYTLAPPDVLGTGAELMLTPGSFTDTAALIGPIGTATVHLTARGPDHRAVPPPTNAAGSICLWGSFPDGSQRRSAAYCNDADPASIIIGSFTDPATGNRYPLPSGFTLTLTLDPLDGRCAAISEYGENPILGATATGFTPAEVCTSWTWGVPSAWGPAGAATPASLPQDVTLAADPSVARYDLEWSSSTAGSKNWGQVAVGKEAACGITTSHALYCWGDNTEGATAQGTTIGTTSDPAKVGTALDWDQVAVGTRHACAINRDHELFCWGANAAGSTGQGTRSGVTTIPTRVGSGRWASVTAGRDFSCGVRQDGSAWCWGTNDSAQLGDPSVVLGFDTAPIVTATHPTELVRSATNSTWVIADGALHELDATGTTISTAVTTGGPTHLALGPDGNVWVSEPSVDKVAKVAPGGSVTEFSTGTLGAPGALTAGPDGALWFAPQDDPSKLGQITTTGVVRSCAITASGPVAALTVGRDGTLWFARSETAKVGKVDPLSCASTEWSVGASARTLALGPDGNVWYATESAALVGRITPAGQIDEWATPDTVTPSALAAASDGGMWMSSSSSATLTHISPDGQLATYQLNDPSSRLRGLTVDTDGVVWISDRANDQLIRFESGTTTPHQLGVATNWTALTAGDRHVCGLQGAALSCWGANEAGQAGVNPPTYQAPYPPRPAVPSPTHQAGEYRSVSAGGAHTCADSNTGLVCFGAASHGQLGTPTGPLAGRLAVGLGQDSDPRQLAVDDTGDVWVTLAGRDAVARYTPSSSRLRTYAVAVDASPDGIALANGSVYIAEPGVGRVARLDPSTDTMTPISIPASRPTRLAADGAGYVWYTSGDTPTVGRIAPNNATGTASEYSVATGDCNRAVDIGAGSDGLTYVIVTGAGCAKVVRLDGAGTLDVLGSLPAGYTPASLVLTDTAAWVTANDDAGHSRLVEFDFAGPITSHGPTAGIDQHGLAGVVVASDGAITYAADGALVSFNEGTTHPLALPSAALIGVTVGPDGTIWASDASQGRLLAITTGSAAPVAIAGGAVWSTVSAGGSHTCATRSGGSLWCWGSNTTGQIGVGDTVTHKTPIRVGTATGWTQVATGPDETTCAVGAVNSLWCWGANTVTGIGESVGYETTPQALSTDQGQADEGTPAAGNGLVPPWTKPRASARAWDGNSFTGACVDGNEATACTSVMAMVAPERFGGADPGCQTDPFCFSTTNAPPQVTSPSSPYGIRPVGPLTSGSMNLAPITFTDPEGEALEFRVAAQPSHGDWYLDATGTPSGGSWHAATSGQPVSFGYVPGDSFTGLDQVTLELREQADGSGERHGHSPTQVTFALYQDPTPIKLSTDLERYTVLQGTANLAIPVTVTASDGAAAVGTPVSVTVADPGLSFTRSSLATSGTGTATFALSVGPAEVGEHTVTFTGLNGTTTAVTVVVAPAPGQIAVALSAGGVATSTLAQGATITAMATVRDLAGAPMTDALVQVTGQDSSTRPATGLNATPGSCQTGALGTCQVNITAAATLPAGRYTLTTAVGVKREQSALTVTAVAAKLTADAAHAGADAYGVLVTRDTPSQWLRLDEVEGDVASATAGAPGTYSGARTMSQDPLAGAGTAASIRFSGGQVCTDTAAPLGSAFTLEAWVRPSTITEGTVWVWGGTTSSAAKLTLIDGAPSFTVPGSVGGAITGEVLPLSTTAHLVGIWAANRMELYVNGRLADTANPGTYADPSTVLCGADAPASSPFKGRLDELAVYPRALESSVVARHAATGTATAAASGTGSASVAQGQTTTVSVAAFDAAGFRAPGATASTSISGTGVTATTATATTDARGELAVTITAESDADATSLRRLIISSGSTNIVVLITVTGRPALVVAAPTTLYQGGHETLAVTVTDANGDAVGGQVVRARLDGESARSAAAHLKLGARASTGATGVAELEVAATAALPAGLYTGTVQARNLSQSFSITVLAGSGRVFVEPGSAALSGRTSILHLVVHGSHDESVGGVSVSLACADCPFTFGPPVTTSNAGVADLTVIDGNTPTAPGKVKIMATVAGRPYHISLPVRSAAGALTLSSPSPVTVPRNGYAFITLLVTDGGQAARPVAGALVEPREVPVNLVVTPARTGPDGKVTILVAARPAATSGSVTLALRTPGVNGTLTINVPLQVQDLP